MKDNKRIISVQVGDDVKQELFYDDAKEASWNLESCKKRIDSLLSRGTIFAGYNVIGFDVVMLKQFLGVEIPESHIFELSGTCRVAALNKIKKYKLEDVCEECGIQVTHKQKMSAKAHEYRQKLEIQKQAQSKALELVRSRGWSSDFSYKYVLDKIAGGNAIMDAYQEFVDSGGSKKTLFYEYAIGDVVSEYQLLKKVKE